MASHVRSITVDTLDPYAQALWWSEVLAVPMSADDNPGDPEALLRTHHGDVLFVQVPDAKTGEEPAHLDLEPSDRSRDDEVARVLALGAVARRRPAPTRRHRLGRARRPRGQRVLRAPQRGGAGRHELRAPRA